MRYAYKTERAGRRVLISFPDCPGCQTEAAPADVQAMATGAVIGWLEAHLVRNRVPPAPVAPT